MNFVNISVHDDDHDLRTFQCEICQYTKNVFVAAEDPSGVGGASNG
jgi:hypothetical protein